ncbi:MAG: sugar ABC transporter permease [Chloroflexi bacterium]|nr:sugar ABC transporter permease [Chloroflexota bacterium]
MTAGASAQQVHKRGAARKSLGARIWRARYLYLFLLPSFAFLIIFVYWPAILAFYRSFFIYDGYSINRFVGLNQYKFILADPEFHISLKNMAIFLAFELSLPLFGPIIAAEAIYNLHNRRHQAFWRFMLIVPAIIPSLVLLLIWQYIYHPIGGAGNILMKGLGLPTQTWLADPALVKPALMFTGVPWVGGVWMLVYLAGLLGIPTEVIDASIVDGASRLRRFFSIDLPLLWGQIKLTMILMIIYQIQGFFGILVLTDGGPVNASLVPGLYLYHQAFGARASEGAKDYGKASAVGVILFLVILILSVLLERYKRSDEKGFTQ